MTTYACLKSNEVQRQYGPFWHCTTKLKGSKHRVQYFHERAAVVATSTADMSVGIHRLLPLLAKQVACGPASVPVQALRRYAAAAGSMALVKDLREKSGAPISDVKSALVEANWDPGENKALHSSVI